MLLGFGVGLSWGGVLLRIPRECVLEWFDYQENKKPRRNLHLQRRKNTDPRAHNTSVHSVSSGEEDSPSVVTNSSCGT